MRGKSRGPPVSVRVLPAAVSEMLGPLVRFKNALFELFAKRRPDRFRRF
jgi:hypothetical protein